MRPEGGKAQGRWCDRRVGRDLAEARKGRCARAVSGPEGARPQAPAEREGLGRSLRQGRGLKLGRGLGRRGRA